jgi:predicted RNA-binding Zn-ribbon protein involved in translation (DUF1610 family)
MENLQMPLPVSPMKITCQSCGWNKVAPKQGDVVFVPKQCERCGSAQLAKESAGLFSGKNLFTFFKDILNK